MPFASMPSSGFQMPSGPDWTQFALQANQLISHGTDLMAQQSRDLVESIDKTTKQVGDIIKEHSPEGRLTRELKLEALKAQKTMFDQYKSMTPAQRADTFEFKNGMLQYKDKYKGMLQGMNLYNSGLRSKVLEAKLAGTPGNPMDVYQRTTSAAAPTTATGGSATDNTVLTGGTGQPTTTVKVGEAEADDTGEGDGGASDGGDGSDGSDDYSNEGVG